MTDPLFGGILSIDLHIARFICQRLQCRAIAGHGTTGVMPHFAHGTEHHRVFFIRYFGRGSPLSGKQLALTVGGIKPTILIEIRGARVFEIRARPLNMAHIAHFLIRYPIE
ncbi:hypothetical protein D3C73_1293300 [compost metagenome]